MIDNIDTKKKRKRVSKKNKSSWRKHSNIKDVEDFLYDQAEEQRLGSISLKKDEDLFTIDTTASSKVICSMKEKRKLNALKKPRNIAQLPETVQEDETKKKGVVPEKHLKRAVRAIKSRKGKLLRIKGKNLKRGVSAFVKDIWKGDLENDKASEYKNEWISRELSLHHLKGTGRPLVKVHQSAHHKTTRAKAFQPPHPGMSYNPRFEDYKTLLQDVVEKEEKIIKEKKHLDRVTKKMFSAVPVEECERFKSCEEPSDDHKDDVDKDFEWEIQDINDRSSNKENKKKTKKERTKQKKVKEMQKQQKVKSERKKQITDFHRLKSILKDVSKEEEKANEIRKRRKKLKQLKKFEPKRLSKVKYEEPDADIVLPEELPENLRNLKCDSKLIVDKFKDFQKRNLLPVSVDVGTRKRHKIKRFVRKSHKE